MNEIDFANESMIDDIAGGYRAAQILFAACRLNLFEYLGTGAPTSGEVADGLGLDRRGTRILLDALAGLGILERMENRYRNSKVALHCLRPGSPRSKYAQMLHGARLYERWAGLYDAVRTGKPVPDEKIDPRLDGGREAFARAMADSARHSAAPTVEELELRPESTLLDIGGGPGAFAIEFARRNPTLTVTVLDDAETLAVAERNIGEAGLADRIRLVPGDAFETNLQGPHDYVFISNVLHIYSPDRNRQLISRAAEALASGGTLILKDFFLESGGTDSKSGPLWSLLFAANMLVGTEGGDCYTATEVFDWCGQAGLSPGETIHITEKSILLLAHRE